MNFEEMKLLVKKGIQGSAEKQSELFFRNKKTTDFFEKAQSAGEKK